LIVCVCSFYCSSSKLLPFYVPLRGKSRLVKWCP
jgi:hypothetical protein